MATQRGLVIGLVVFVVVMMGYLMSQTPPGAPMALDVPDFALPLAAPAQPTRMSALRGKVVIVDFWATWCGPCRMSMPGLEAIYKKYKDRGLVVIGISEDDPKMKREVETTKQNLGVTYPTVLAGDLDNIGSKFPHDSIPALYLIDKQGKIVDAEQGFDENEMAKLDVKIAELLTK